MIDAFVDGRLSAGDHELMVHHISSCTECAAAVIAALAEAARALAAEANERPAAWTSNGARAPTTPAEEEAQATPADLLQLDFILDRTSMEADLLLRRDEVQEVELDDLQPPEEFRSAADPVIGDSVPAVEPAAPVAATRDAGARSAEARAESILSDVIAVEVLARERADAELVAPGGSAEEIADYELHTAVESPRIGREEPAPEIPRLEAVALQSESAEHHESLRPAALAADDSGEIASMTAAGVADSVAHGAAALAQSASLDLSSDLEFRHGSERPAAPDAAQAAETEVPVFPVIDADIVAATDAATDATSGAPEESELVGAELSPQPAAEPAHPTEGAEAAAGPRPDDRIPDETRAAIVSLVRADAEPLPPRRGLSVAMAALAALLVFGAIGAYAALQLRGFADPDAHPAPQIAPLSSAQPIRSVLAPVIDSAAFTGVIEFPDTAVAVDVPVATPGRDSAVTPRASAVREEPRQQVASRRASQSPPRGITPAPAGALLPRLLRTTTHQHGSSYLVLREYDANAPAPGSRPGVNEYRWTDETLTRLFVLTGPVQVAELRAFARKLHPAPSP